MGTSVKSSRGVKSRACALRHERLWWKRAVCRGWSHQSQYVVMSLDNSVTSRSCSVWLVSPWDQWPFHRRFMIHSFWTLKHSSCCWYLMFNRLITSPRSWGNTRATRSPGHMAWWPCDAADLRSLTSLACQSFAYMCALSSIQTLDQIQMISLKARSASRQGHVIGSSLTVKTVHRTDYLCGSNTEPTTLAWSGMPTNWWGKVTGGTSMKLCSLCFFCHCGNVAAIWKLDEHL